MTLLEEFWTELAEVGFVPRGELVPCQQDHVHSEICRFCGDAPIHTPTRKEPRRYDYPVIMNLPAES